MTFTVKIPLRFQRKRRHPLEVRFRLLLHSFPTYNHVVRRTQSSRRSDVDFSLYPFKPTPATSIRYCFRTHLQTLPLISAANLSLTSRASLSPASGSFTQSEPSTKEGVIAVKEIISIVALLTLAFGRILSATIRVWLLSTRSTFLVLKCALKTDLVAFIQLADIWVIFGFQLLGLLGAAFVAL
ncbi:hypothetical protein QBC44DRAFT_356682, partial [Cladorrhinum sp. PSN332]